MVLLVVCAGVPAGGPGFVSEWVGEGRSPERADLHLKAVALGQVDAVAVLAQACGSGPVVELLGLEAQPQVAAQCLGPGLVVAAELGDHQHRSEERRVGKERTSRLLPYEYRKEERDGKRRKARRK